MRRMSGVDLVRHTVVRGRAKPRLVPEVLDPSERTGSRMRLRPGALARVAALLSALVVVVVAAASASAQNPQHVAEAQGVFAEGEAAFASENYAIAVNRFRRTYELLEGHPRRAIPLFNIARSLEEIGELETAIETYRRYLGEADEAFPMRDEAAQRIEELESRLAIRGSSESTPTEPGRERSTQPTDASPWPAITMVSGGVVAAVGGLLWGLAAMDVANVEGAPLDARWEDHEAAYDRSEALSIAGISLLAVGVAAFSVGLVWLLVDGESGDESMALRVGPGGLSLVGSW